MNPKISVIIPCYNYAHYLTESVESVINQTFKDFEIIIVNDGSTDNTIEIAEALIKKYAEHKLFLINQENSKNPAIARNNGIKIARGEFILCLDADDKLAPTMLEECLSVLEKREDVAIAYTDRLDFNGIEKIIEAGDYDFEKLKYENHISYCALYRKEIWEKIGGYRTNVIGCEDWDFWIAAGSSGFYGYRIKKPLFMYRQHQQGVFQIALRNMKLLKAQIVINNSSVYSDSEIQNAKKVLEDAKQNNFEPEISVILPTYNRPKELERALRSLNNQKFQNFEVIIVNDGGVDVENIVENLNLRKNFVYIRHIINKGLPSARNSGIRGAKGKYIAYLDDDDIFYPEHLEVLYSALKDSNSEIAYTDSMKVVYKKDAAGVSVLKREKFYSEDFDKEKLLVENYIPIICVMHLKKCFDEVGYFDESLKANEDWDLLIRLSQKYNFKHIERVTCEFSAFDDDVVMSQKRANFISVLPLIYERYRHLINNDILDKQKSKLIESLQWAYDHIVGLEKEKSELSNKLLQYNLQIDAMQNNLSWRILNRYIFRFWDKWVIPFGSKRRAILERFFRQKLNKDRSKKLTSQNAVPKKVIKSSKPISDIIKFNIYTHSRGNYFFKEISDLIKDGLSELGYDTETKNENDWWYDKPTWHIVVAPHEFFKLQRQNSKDFELIPENLILVNTEQPSTQWYAIAEEYFPYAKDIWDINFESAEKLKEKGLSAKYLPLGYVKNNYLFQIIQKLPENYATCFLNSEIKNKSYFTLDYKLRPIDISFVGCFTHRRSEIFAKLAPAISNFHTYIHFSEGLNSPVVPGVTTHMNTEIVLGLMQRSKITLNIHQSVDKYFEWHRIVLLGIAQKNLVISEPTVRNPIFEPGKHYIEAKVSQIPKLINYYLKNHKGIEEAKIIIDNGYKKFTENCLLKDSLKSLLANFYHISNV